MKNILAASLIACLPCLGALGAQGDSSSDPTQTKTKAMDLGAFSVSLAVKDLSASKAFYTKLGFTKKGGDEKQNWLVLKNGDTVIGLFQGMFEDNIMTFNPGWDQSGEEVDKFTDVRKLQETLKEKGITPVKPIDDDAFGKTGPASFVITDPDGNAILVDQHR